MACIQIATSVLRSWSRGLCFIQSVGCSSYPSLVVRFLLSFSCFEIVSSLTVQVIGITLSVTPNSFYTTLFVVILFHQMFEGLALGTRIAALKSSTSFLTKTLMAAIFTLITPVGMAIGVGVLQKFNGNDPATIVAIGTLDALSAGILLWVGLVEMLAQWVVIPLRLFVPDSRSGRNASIPRFLIYLVFRGWY